ncbi:MAG: hypothetical protein HY877_06370 [Deltaproteobacteria bacterium]|nr:hypothetical protein [Deltaproteobacteria bacterium]
MILLLSLASEGFAAGRNLEEKWLNEIFQLQETYQKLDKLISISLQDYQQAVVNSTIIYPFEKSFLNDGEKKVVVDWAHIPYGTEKKWYDHTAVIWEQDVNKNWHRIAEVDWDSTKTGILPGPEASTLRNHSFKIDAEEINEAPNHFYRGLAQFNNKIPNPGEKRGYAEFFQDLQRGSMKISTSVVEGPANLTLDQIEQHNAQAIFGLNSYIYLTVDKKYFCKNPQGAWVGQNSREWDESCAPLFDKPPSGNGHWAGFSYNLLPSSFNSFLSQD